MLQDLSAILTWNLAIFLIGLIFFPLTRKIFGHFFDHGYIFAKILGILLVSYTVWLLSSLHLLPFTQTTIIAVLIGWIIVNLLLIKFKTQNSNYKPARHPAYCGRANAGGSNPKLKEANKKPFGIWIFEEALFLFTLLFWSWVRGHEPAIHGLEKFMDFGFINSILHSQFFPPHDMWLSPASDPRYTQGFFINYYYYGHYTTAFLTKLTGILPEITYNLMLSTIFAFSFSLSFSIGANLVFLFHKKSAQGIKFMNEWLSDNPEVNFRFRTLIGGLLTGALVTIAGNLHTIYLFTSGYVNEKPVPFWQIFKFSLNLTYWYPNATRFIPFTIHEFPSYSWIVADLHGHVLDIPFVLLTIGLLLSLVTKSKVQMSNDKSNLKLKIQNNSFGFWGLKLNWHLDFGIWILLLLGLLTAVMYMTNAWDGAIYLVLSMLIIAVRHFVSQEVNTNHNPQSSKHLKFGVGNLFGIWILLFGFFFLFALPFNLRFQPFVHGIGIVGGWEIARSLGLVKETVSQTANTGVQEVVKMGPFLLEKGNNLRSPLWMMAVLWGFFYFNVGIFFWRLAKKIGSSVTGNSLGIRLIRIIRNLNTVELFLLLLILLSTLLLIFPEFFYMKDIYPAHYRANTMFKLGYQAFIMLSIVSGYVITQFFNLNLKNSILFQILRFGLRVFWLFLLILVLIYPYFGIQSYYGAFGNRRYESQNGLLWLKNSHPGDYDAVLWIRNRMIQNTSYDIPNTILEAVGDSYTDYGRISANTGLTTILGWPVHEWLWRGSYDEPGKRVEEVRQIYETNINDRQNAYSFLHKYSVRYVVVGDLEREKYKNLNEETFKEIGKIVFSSQGTKIYKIVLP